MVDAPRPTAALALVVAVAAAPAVATAVGLAPAVGAAAPGAVGPAPPVVAASPTPVDGCTAITEPGEYVLADDLENADVETCVEIRTDDVTLDGASHAIDGGSLRRASAGVSVAPGSANVTVRNLTVSRWAFGVRYEGVTDGEITGVTARLDGDGIHVEDSRSVAVRSATADSNFVGVAVSGSERVAIEDASARWNVIYGVSLAESETVAVSNVTTARNEIGLGAYRTADFAVRDASAASNRLAGLELAASAHVRVSNAAVRDHARWSYVRSSRGFDAVRATDVVSTGTRDSRVRNLTTGANWSVTLGARSVDASVSLDVENAETLSLSGSGVVVSSAALPPTPAASSALGEAFRAEATAPNATLSVALRYADADLTTAGVEESTLGLWRYDERVWTPVSDGHTDRNLNLVRAAVTDFSTFAVLGERTAGTADLSSDPGPVGVTRRNGVDIDFACDGVRVSVPPGTGYSLDVHYFVPESGEYERRLLGPLDGTTVEPFDADIVFFEVNVRVGGATVASGYIPEACPNAPGLALDSPGSARSDGDKP